MVYACLLYRISNTETYLVNSTMKNYTQSKIILGSKITCIKVIRNTRANLAELNRKGYNCKTVLPSLLEDECVDVRGDPDEFL